MLGGGVIADRFGPRRVVIGGDATRCAVILAMAALLAVATPGLWALVAVALVFGAVDALFMPAVSALPPRLTGPDQLARVQGMKGLATRFATVAGAPLGGMAMAFGGVAAAFGVAGALFAVSLVLLIAVRVGPLPGDGTEAGGLAWRDLADGFRHIRANRALTALVVVGAAAELGLVGPLNIGVTMLANERGWGAAGLGWIISGFGIGAGVASLLLTVRGRVPRAGLVMCVGGGLGAVAAGALAYVPSLPAAVAVGALIGLAAGLGGALVGALLQALTSAAYLGRVGSVMTLCSVGLAPMSYPLFGAGVAGWGLEPVFTVSAAVTLVAVVYGLASPALRGAELPR
jgi:MFS family permease